jgi:GNAT superfamily N-acetyltransferase
MLIKTGITNEIAEKIYYLLIVSEKDGSYENKAEGLSFLEETYPLEKIKLWENDYVVSHWEKETLIAFGRAKKDGWITHVYVANRYKKQGLGSKILSVLEEKLQKGGHKEMFLNAEPKALSFYKKYGWVEKVAEPINYHGILLIPMVKSRL